MSFVFISPPTLADRVAFLDAVARSTDLHGQWVAPPCTPEAFRRYVARTSQSDHAGFLIRLREQGQDHDALAGVVNVSNIVGEPLSSGFLGFYAFEPYAKQGYMRAGMQLVLARAFGDLGLHRLEANVQPSNAASLALVRACGFRREGFSPKYLHIAGDWRDHERWAILAEEFHSQGDCVPGQA